MACPLVRGHQPTRTARTAWKGTLETGLDEAGFVQAAQGAKAGCPVSKALTGIEITLDAALA